MRISAPFNDLLPPLSNEEREALESSIRAEGVRDPILVDEDGNILDGHHRFAINPNVPVRVVAGLTPAEKMAFVYQANLTRRNLSPDQKREIRKRMKAVARALREEDPGKNTQERVAALLGVARETVRDWFRETVRTNGGAAKDSKPSLDARVKIPPKAHATIVARVEAGESQAQVAADYGVSQRAVSSIVAKQRKRLAKADRFTADPPLPSGPYDVILADPPWRYDFSETVSRAIENQYPTLDVAEIKGKRIPSAENAALFLWATAPKLREALEVMEAWGFTYRTCAVWDKERIGMGYWFRSQHELLLVGTKGNIEAPASSARVSSVIRSPRRDHSRKPEAVYEIIEAMFPQARLLEVFGRDNKRSRWTVWGNEAA